MDAARTILTLLHHHGAASQAEIVRKTHLHQSTVFKVVQVLLQQGLVQVQELGQSSGGRPPLVLALNGPARHVVGVDLGTTMSRMIVVDLAGHRTVAEGIPVGPAAEARVVLANVRAALQGLVQGSAFDPVTLVGIGLSLPGLVDTIRRVCLYSPNLGWRNVALPAAVEVRGPGSDAESGQARSLPVLVENSSRAMALAEQWYGRARGIDDFVYIKIGRGIGGAVWVHGRPIAGTAFGAGEVGHLPVVEDGPLCTCGRRGCLQAVASGSALTREARARGLTGVQDARELADLARGGSAVACAVFEHAGYLLGKAIAMIDNILNPQKVIVGGGVAQALDLLYPALQRGLQDHALEGRADQLPVEASTVGLEAAAIGAAILPLSSLIAPYSPPACRP
jgi:N-acetylglucosamine repressor